MKKTLKFVLFAAAVVVLFAGQGGASYWFPCDEYYGIEIGTLTAAGANIDASSKKINVINNVLQAGGVSISSTVGNHLVGAHINISTGVKIGNITANRNSAIVDGLKTKSGSICGSHLELDSETSIGNVVSNENFVSIKNCTNVTDSYDFDIWAVSARIQSYGGIGSIDMNSNKVEADNVKGGSYFSGVLLQAPTHYSHSAYSRSAFTVNSNGNEISIINSDIYYIQGNDIDISGICIVNLISNNNRTTISDSKLIGACGVRAGNYLEMHPFDDDIALIKDVKTQTNNNSLSISKSNASFGFDPGIFGVALQGGSISAAGNSVSIIDSPSLFFNCIYGVDGEGRYSGSLNGNSVFVKNTSAGQRYGDVDIFGARLHNEVGMYGEMEHGIFETNNNSVHVENIINVIGKIYGGCVSGSEASVSANNNSVYVLSCSSGIKHIYGGYADSVEKLAAAIGNNINIADSRIKDVFGGYAKGEASNAQADKNSVSILNANMDYGFAAAAYGEGQNVSVNNNRISVEGSSNTRKIIGGYVEWADLSAQVNGNFVSVKNVNTDYSSDVKIYGAELLHGGDTNEECGVFEASNNSVRVENLKSVSNDTGIYGVWSDVFAGIGKANNNSVYVLNSTVGYIMGSRISSWDTDAVTAELHANGNTATVIDSVISNGSGFGSIFASYCTAYASTFANDNKLYIKGGRFSGVIIYGAWAWSETGKEGRLARANNNSVIIENVSSAQNCRIVGGRAHGNYDGGQIQAINNTVTIIGDLDINESIIYGGYAENAGTGGADYFTGNTLNAKNGHIKAYGIGGFENYNFYIQSLDASMPIISVSSGNGAAFFIAGVNEAIDISSLNIGMCLSQDIKLTGDETIVLIKSGLGFEGAPKASQVAAQQGFAWLNVFDIYVDTNTKTLNAGFIKRIINPQTKSLSEGVAAGAILAGQGSDIVNSGLLSGLQEGKIEAVGALFGGSLKYDTGSFVEMSVFGAAAGFAKKFSGFDAGAFIEYANGNFDTEYNGIKGDGQASAIGLSIIAKKDVNEKVYVEGLIRGGQLSNDYKTKLSDKMTGETADFDYSSIYFGFGFGAGYIYKVSEKINIDGFGKYMLTSIGGGDTDLKNGDKYEFDSVLSNRIKFGAKGEYKINETIRPYLSLSYDYELSGDVNAKIEGSDTESPSLNGGTFSAGLGASAKVTEKLTLNLSAQVYSGVKEGVTGNLQVKYSF